MGITSKKELLRQLESELEDHNDFFDMLVDMIPSKLYVAGKSGDDFNPKYFKGVSEQSKEARKMAAKASKRRKLDPTTKESTTGAIKSQIDAMNTAVAVSPAESSDTDTVQESSSSNEAHRSTVARTTTGQSRIEALRAKLHAKIASKQGNRPAPEVISKRAARRVEKNKRRETAKKQSASNTASNATTYKMPSTTSARVDPTQDLQDIDFGRLGGLNTNTKHYSASNKSLNNLSKGKNLQKLLADSERKRIKMESLKGTEQGKSMEWTDTFKEADGIRVKDDPKKLKKAIARKAAKKVKSQKAWKVRAEQSKESAQNRQKIRQHNLKSRMAGGSTAANLSSKKIVEEKKEGRRAGFEGKRQSFINSPKEVKGGKGNKTR